MLNIINKHRYRIALLKASLLEIFAATLLKKSLSNDKFSASLVFCDRSEILQLNQKYRSKQTETDVLSFPWNADFDLTYLGDILVCYPVAIERSQNYHHSEKREICFLFLHGLLHLLGHDHHQQKDEEEMLALQREILNDLGITRESLN